jgi:hypothetical protein
MRFFRDRDDQNQTNAGEHPEAVRSNPVPVPQRHPGDTDQVDAALEDRGTFDDPVVPGAAVARPFFGTEAEQAAARADANRRPPAGPWASEPHPAAAGDPAPADEEFAYHEPAPQPTAFGAATVGGAVAASAAAGRASVDDNRADTDRRTGADSGVADDRMGNDPAVTGDRIPDGVIQDRGTFHDPAIVGTQPIADADRISDGDRVPDGALHDRGTFDDPAIVGTQPATDTDRVPDGALHDRGTFNDPVVTGEAPATDGGTTASGQVPAAVGPMSDGPLSTGPADDESGRLFPDGDAQFRDRWRDVQLRFVDDPRAAADEARGLLDEVVDALTVRLRARKDQLGGTSGGDTEQLRMELRRYRDFLDRLLGL